MIDEQELREILDRRASTIAATPPVDTTTAVRRGRRRQLLAGSLGVLVTVGLVIGAFSGIRAFESSQSVPGINPSPSIVPPSIKPSPSDKPSASDKPLPWGVDAIPDANDSHIVLIHFYSNGGQAPKDPSVLPPPADDLLRSADSVTKSSSCQFVTAAEAHRTRRELIDAFGFPLGGSKGLGFPYGFLFTPVTISPITQSTRCP
jgi:hypothetical protein